MKEITILWTRYSDCLSSLVHWMLGHPYTHASLSLEENQGIYYSFNFHGFCEETLEKHRRRGVEQSMSCVLEVSDQAYQRIQAQVEEFKQRRKLYHYTRLGVLFCLLHIPFLWRRHYFCSQFVADVLKRSGALTLSKKAQLYLPQHLWAEVTASGQLVKYQLNPV